MLCNVYAGSNFRNNPREINQQLALEEQQVNK